MSKRYARLFNKKTKRKAAARPRIFAALLACACVLHASPTPAGTFTAGFLTLPSAEPPAAIWYPSTAAETPGKLGAFDATWAWDGAPAQGAFPLIVLSHGNGGRYRNHRDTAATLARNGYVVVAPDHARDAELTSLHKFVSVMPYRARELHAAIAAARAHPLLNNIIHPNQTGAIGYSLGTATALYAAGATPQRRLFLAHCSENRAADPKFCGGNNDNAAGIIRNLIRDFFAIIRATIKWLQSKGILKPRDQHNRHDNLNEFVPLKTPLKFQAIALVAPIGAPFPADALRALSAQTPIALYRLGADRQLRYPFHAHYLHTILNKTTQSQPQHKHHYQTYPRIPHRAFISPFPQEMIDNIGDSVMLDPPGFNRPQFLTQINADLTRFFQRHLPHQIQ